MATINGITGNDTLRGTTGANNINGRAGSNTLIGGRGADALTGGRGADIFKYSGFNDALGAIAIGNGSAAAGSVDISCDGPVCRTEKSEDSPPPEAFLATADEAASSSGTVGVIETSGEVDYYNISLVAGQTYTIAMTGTGGQPLADSIVSLTRLGTTVASDDDGGVGYNSLLTFTATATGTYQIVAQAYTGTGEYTIDVRQMGSDTSSPEVPAEYTVGTTVIDFIETSGDNDVYAVNLEAGQYYTFELAGGADRNTDHNAVPPGELDTVLRIYDDEGDLVRASDDMGSDLSSGFGFVAPETGTYYVDVSAYANQTGGYALTSSRNVGDFSELDPLDAIDWGTELASNTITVYFAPHGETYDEGSELVTSLGWSGYEIGQAMAALRTYADVANLNISITNNQSTATFTLLTTTSAVLGDSSGRFNPPGTENAGVGLFNTDNNYAWNTTGGLEQGGYAFYTLLHEFGHGLGLAHPHDDGGGMSSVMPLVTSYYSYGAYDLNQGVYTTMSYNDGWQLHPSGAPGSHYGRNGGPSALDIALIQAKYGAVSARTGNNVYVLPTANAVGTFYDAIWDTRGVDTIQHNGIVSAIIDLTAATLDYSATGGGVISYVKGIYGGFTIAAQVVIENATGGSGADTLIGNDARNVLNGRGRGDTMEGRDGSDTYVVNHSGDVVIEAAGQGSDRVEASVSYTLTANVENLTLTGTRGISGTGNVRNNIITGNDAGNKLRGLGGSDTVKGAGGADDLYGGLGNDRLTGGAGNDDFYFDAALSATTNVDRITDFSSADSFKLDLSVFSGIAAGKLTAGAFRLGNAAADANDRIIYHKATGNIYYDADGSGGGAKVLFAQVADGTTLTNADFIGFRTVTTSRTTSAGEDSSSEWQASDVFSFEAESVMPLGEFVEPAHLLDQQQWSQMQDPARLNWSSVDYFSA